jgi:hypothetical protein
MNTTPDSRTARLIRRAAQIWEELDYAQRRLLEIRTGVPNLTRTERARRRD